MAEDLKVTCIQMNMLLGETEYNFSHVQKLIEKAIEKRKENKAQN